MKYTIKSKGKYLSSLSSDSHKETFAASSKFKDVYYYNVKQIAEDIANQLESQFEELCQVEEI
jgi:hypothetical protein